LLEVAENNSWQAKMNDDLKMTLNTKLAYLVCFDIVLYIFGIYICLS